MMYMVMSILKFNVDIQKRGFVGIMYDIGLQEKDEAMMLGLAKFRHCLPLQLSAIHHCSDNQFVRAMFTIELIFMETYERVRYRGHFGTHMECQYSLHTFGQPKHGFPVSESGEYKLQQLMDLLSIFRKHEEEEARALSATAVAPAVTPEAVAGVARQPQLQHYHDSSGSAMSLNSGSERSNRSNDSNESSTMSRSGSPNDIIVTAKMGNKVSQRAGTPPLGPSSSTACSSRRKIRNPSIGSANSGGGGVGGGGLFLVPQPSDVLLGRGKQIQEHSGNVRFRKLLDMHLQRYEQVGKYEKTEIAERKSLTGYLGVFRFFVLVVVQRSV